MLVSGVSAGYAADYADGIAAIVGDEVITVYDVVRRGRPVEASLRERYEGEELRDKIKTLREQVARQMVEEELLHLEYEARGMQLPKEYVDKRLDAVVVSRAGGSYEKFEEMLAAENMTLEEFREQLVKRLAAQVLVDQLVRRQVTVTREEVEEYYEANIEQFRQSGAVHLGVIFLQRDEDAKDDALKRAQQVLEELSGGADFAAMAKANSDEKISAAKGGDLGWIDTDKGREAFIDAVSDLQAGQVSRPVVQPEGIYILKLLDRRDTAVSELDDDLRAEIRNRLENRRFQKKLDEFLADLRRKYFVKKFYGG